MALRRRLISSTIALLASESRQRTGSSSTAAKSAGCKSGRSGALTEAIWTTWLWTLTPSALSRPRASEPAATRAAVSRALARSSTLRMSLWPYFCAPTRSAWPGPRQVDLFGLDPSTGQGFIRSSQLA